MNTINPNPARELSEKLPAPLKLKLCRSLDAFFRIKLNTKLKREDSFTALAIDQEKSSSILQIVTNDPDSYFAAEVMQAIDFKNAERTEVADLIEAALGSDQDSMIRCALLARDDLQQILKPEQLKNLVNSLFALSRKGVTLTSPINSPYQLSTATLF